MAFTLSYFLFLGVLCSSIPSTSSGLAISSSLKNSSSRPLNAIPLKMHTTGVSVNIKRTITPAKYTALIAYKTTENGKVIEFQKEFECTLLSPNTLSSLIFFIQYHKPAGNVATKTCKSKKKENHVVG